ncbi:hypothetical protein FOMG_07510 [Fusarium oxysporum f. sp. melonis 26406]|uniref:Uncharacterized protein n=1 Tax=Fusarium oxysporum f. sp. melonis 26406 TaxID=1089452 RepID=X0AAR9_FUSOX|nr:hypothetical protein FOMG_07510 [Fusarium oxysporum f. sp. melonis 26406]
MDSFNQALITLQDDKTVKFNEVNLIDISAS